MNSYTVRILEKDFVTHNVLRFLVEKPKNYKFIPGQATEIAIDLDSWREKKRPFTLASLNSDDYLEFIIKSYEERNGVTKKLRDLKVGDSFIIGEPFGTIEYKDKGIFIAGGAGVTPFIAILRQLKKEKKLEGNTLFFSNKTEKDIILKSEFDSMINEGLEVIYTLTREKNTKYSNGRIDEKFLREYVDDFSQHFYVCGPIRFVGEIQSILQKLGADAEKIIVES